MTIYGVINKTGEKRGKEYKLPNVYQKIRKGNTLFFFIQNKSNLRRIQHNDSSLLYTYGPLKKEIKFKEISALLNENKLKQVIDILDGYYLIIYINFEENRVILLRDVWGVCPIFYTDNSKSFEFSDKISLLHRFNNINEVNVRKIPEYFRYGYPAGRETLFKGIYSMIPFEYLKVDENRLLRHKIYEFPEVDNSISFDSAIKELNQALEESLTYISREIPNSNKLFMPISGGIDSGILAALLTGIYGDNGFRSGSVMHKNWDRNENKYFEYVRDAFNLNHFIHEIDGKEYADRLDDTLKRVEYPLSIGVYPSQFSFLQNIKKYFPDTVYYVSGEGPDETMSGMFWSLTDEKINEMRDIPRNRWSDILISHGTFTPETVINRVLGKSIPTDVSAERKKIAGDLINTGLGFMEIQRRYTFLTYLQELFRWTYNSSTYNEFEPVFPYCTKRIFDFIFKTPYPIINKTANKGLLKEIARRYYPDWFVDRKKVGFGAPNRMWFKQKESLGRYIEFIKEKNIPSIFDSQGYKEIDYRINDENAPMDYLLWVITNTRLWLKLIMDDNKKTL